MSRKGPQRVSMNLPVELFRRIKMIAAKDGCNVGDVVARLAEEHLPPIEQDDKAA